MMSKPEHDDTLNAFFKIIFAFKKTMKQNFSLLNTSLNMMHLRVLRIIALREQCMPLEIAKELHRDKAQITRLLKELIDQELIQKSENPSDKRSFLLSLTAKGNKTLEEFLQAEDQSVAALTQGVSQAEQAQFVALVDKMILPLHDVQVPIEFSGKRHRGDGHGKVDSTV